VGKPPDTFGARLLALRQQAGLTQAELAARAGLTQPAVNRYELGARQPTWVAVHALAGALGVSTEAFRPTPTRQ
jgi:transcriptional regulator with XRE-family HTH domain